MLLKLPSVLTNFGSLNIRFTMLITLIVSSANSSIYVTDDSSQIRKELYETMIDQGSCLSTIPQKPTGEV
ncbi:hypothetical protein ZIOFF_045692 [Zingiber officinale]|uniref:Uncharacterized protein n=1 Tax=Zingiber officinale TaxID=94328 RepID=A0A8J5L1H3_ZINOF|nr:hypothetical protein ZIOFF_045692 [Zingiber officinale]